MRLLALVILLATAVISCHGPGGSATRAGRAVDNAVSGVGRGVERTGEAIQDVAD